MDLTTLVTNVGISGAFAITLLILVKNMISEARADTNARETRMAARMDKVEDKIVEIASEAVRAQSEMAGAIKGYNAVQGKLAGSVYKLATEMQRRPCGDKSQDVADVSRQSAQVAAGS